MPRPTRVEYEGARYHVLSRGDRQEAIVEDDEDKKRFVETLAEAAGYAGWEVHAYCLMINHFHLVIETPQPTLVKGMQWMLGTYTARYNARHKKKGHVFAGRYKTIVVDEAGRGYLRRVCDYTHLNPVRAKIVGCEEALGSYEWSSYPLYLENPRKRPKWLRVDRLLGEHGIEKDTAAGRRELSRRMEARRGEEDEEFARLLQRGWRLGAEDFVVRLQDRMKKPPGEHHEARQVNEMMEVKARRIIAEELKRRTMKEEDLGTMRKGDAAKVAIAERIHRETPMRLKWIAESLRMGSWRYVAFLLYQTRRKNGANKV